MKRRTKKKGIAWFVCFVMLATLFLNQAPVVTKAAENDILQVYTWNTEFVDTMNYFFEKYPEYKDRVKVNNLELGGASEDYLNETKKIMQDKNNGTSIIAFDSTVIDQILPLAECSNLSDIGFDEKLYANAYNYTKKIGSYNNKLKALAWQANPGNIIYDKSIAEEVLGTSDRYEVQEYLSTPEKFIETAKKMKAAGYYMTTGADCLKNVLSASDATKIPEAETLYNSLVSGGYDTGNAIWTDGYINDMDSGNVFCMFSCTWHSNWSTSWITEESPVEPAICPGPLSYVWGGTYLTVSNKGNCNELASLVLQTICCDEEVMEQLYDDRLDYPNNCNVGKEILYVKNHYKLDMPCISWYSTLTGEKFRDSRYDNMTGNDDVLRIYSWNSELGDRLDYFYELYPEYKDRVAYFNLGAGSTSEEYLNTTKSFMESEDNGTCIVAYDSDVIGQVLPNSACSYLSDIGFDEKLYDNAYDYTKMMGSYNNKLKALAREATPGNIIYDTAIAEKVLGTSDPDKVQTYLSTPEKFLETAKKMKDAGYYMTSGANSLESFTSLKDGSRNMPEAEALYNALIAGGYDTGALAWTDEYNNDMESGNVFCFFSCSWHSFWTMLWTIDDLSTVKPAICEGPLAYAWGGTYLTVSNKGNNTDLANLVLATLCCDESTMYRAATETLEFPNNKNAAETLIINKGFQGFSDIQDNPAAVWHKVLTGQDLRPKWQDTYHLSEVDSSKKIEVAELEMNGFDINKVDLDSLENATYDSTSNAFIVDDLSRCVKYNYSDEGKTYSLLLVPYQFDEDGMFVYTEIIYDEYINHYTDEGYSADVKEMVDIYRYDDSGMYTRKKKEEKLNINNGDLYIYSYDNGMDSWDGDGTAATLISDSNNDVADAVNILKKRNDLYGEHTTTLYYMPLGKDTIIKKEVLEAVYKTGISFEMEANFIDDQDYEGAYVIGFYFDNELLTEDAIFNDVDLKYHMYSNIIDYPETSKLQKLIGNDKNATIISFKEHMSYPLVTHFNVHLDSKYKEGSNVYAYIYQPEDQNLIFMDQYEVFEDYIYLDVPFGADYVITNQKLDDIISVTNITLDTTNCTLTEGETKQVIATMSPENATNKEIIWTSSNEAVATVDTNGLITAVKAGTATITVTSKDASGKAASCAVTVKEKTTPEPQPEIIPDVTVSYTTHVQSIGWQGDEEDASKWFTNGTMAGTSGMAKRLEGIKIRVSSNSNLGIQYTTHCQSYGWLPWSANGEMNGTQGEAKRLESIKIKLTGADANKYDVYYRVHAQSYGWLGWAKNGAPSGSAGYGKRLEGIQIVIKKKGEAAPGLEYAGLNVANFAHRDESYVALAGQQPVVGQQTTSSLDPQIAGDDQINVTYRTHVQTYGWQAWKYNGQMSGTSGEAKRLEGINIRLTNQTYSGSIVYTTHVQTYGWQGNQNDPNTWVRNGKTSGTSGEAKRLEAIRIALTGEMAEHYDIYYRVHAQSFGWLNWAKNGDPAGTAGLAKRLEGIQIVLVPKGNAAPANTYNGVTAARRESFIK